jgi:membrane protein
VLVLTFVLSTVGERLLFFLDRIIPENILSISDSYIILWQYLRFIIIALLMLGAIGILYLVSLDKRQKLKTVLPGILSAAVLWVILSIGFSYYVENFANYSLVYGTLGAIIVLLIWLYMTALILILGAELNSAIDKVQKEEH